MALLDVKQYYLQLEKQYLDLLKFSDSFEKEFKEGRVSEEQLNNFEINMNKVKDVLVRTKLKLNDQSISKKTRFFVCFSSHSHIDIPQRLCYTL